MLERPSPRTPARTARVLSCAACALLLAACGATATHDAPDAPPTPATEPVADAASPPTPTTRPMSDTPPPDAAEPLSAPSHDGTHVSAGVLSHGCTSADDFGVEHELVDGACRVTVTRPSPDLCRAAPRVVTVRIAWTPPPECAGLAVEFANPELEAPSGPPARRLPDE